MWFKVDDNLAFHQKTLRAGNAAMGMWVRAGSECSSQLTDGFVADELVASLGGKKLAEKLVAARLWVHVEGGFQFHQWNEDGRQPTRAQVEEERKAARLRKQQWRDKRAADAEKSRRDKSVTDSGTTTGTDGGTDAVVTGGVPPTPTRPDPTRPDPESLKGLQEKNKDSAEPSKSDRFDEFWNAFPKHVAKIAAKKRWDVLAKQGVDPQRIIDGAVAYARQVRGSDQQFVKQPDGWLLAGRWDDEPSRTGTVAVNGFDPVTNRPKSAGWEFGMDR